MAASEKQEEYIMPGHETAIERLCNLYALGRVEAHELPGIAETLISDGKDAPSLRALLTIESPYSEDSVRLFEAAISELGLRIPGKEEAAVALARETALKISKGGIGEYEGAMKIWKEVVDYVDPVPERLWVFKSNASVIEDCMTDTELHGSDHNTLITKCKKEIMDAAKILSGGFSITVKELRNRVVTAVSECLRGMGFIEVSGGVYYRHGKSVVQVIEVCFLDRHQASYFGSNTASFGIYLGVYYDFVSYSGAGAQTPVGFPPREYECHFRRCLLRDIEQEEPHSDQPVDSETEAALNETAQWLRSFFKERHGRDVIAAGPGDAGSERRDLWWVDKTGSNIDEVIHSAVRVIQKDAKPWLDRFSRPVFAFWHTLFVEDGDSWDGAAFGLGRRWSPHRKAILIGFVSALFRRQRSGNL